MEFGITRAYFCLPSTSPHINHHPSPSSLSLPGSRLSFALKQSKPQTNIRTSTGAHTHLHNSALKSGFPIAPAHTKQNVSSDYRYCSLLASGVSILNLFFFLPPLYDKLILSLCHYRLENYSMQRCISSGVVKLIQIASVKMHFIKNPLSSICCCENGEINDKKWIHTYSQAREQHQCPTGRGVVPW